MIIGIGKQVKKQAFVDNSLISGITISEMRFDGGINSDRVIMVLYREYPNSGISWSDYDNADALVFANLFETQQSLTMTGSGFVDGPNSGMNDGLTYPYSWFNGVHPITITIFPWNPDSILVDFGARNDLGVVLPEGGLYYSSKSLVSNISWHIDLA